MSNTTHIIDITDRFRIEIRCYGPMNAEWVAINGATDYTSIEADVAIFNNVVTDCNNGIPDMFEYRKVAQ